MRRHRHDRAGAVLHQHVVGDPDRDLLAVRGVQRVAPGEDAGLLARRALLGRPRGRDPRVGTHLVGEPGAFDQLVDERRLGRDDEERRPEDGVRSRREHGDVTVELVDAEEQLGALGTADVLSLDLLRPLGPVDRLQVVEQLVGVGGDLEEPLLHVPRLDDRPAAPAAAVDDVLVREHGLVVRAPVDGRLLAVGQPVLEQLQEQPLRPAVVGRLVRRDLAAPVDRPAHAAHLVLDRRDVALGDRERVAALLDRGVLGGQPERVEAHRPQHLEAVAPAEVRDDVAERVVEDVPHVQRARRVRQHLEHVEVAVVVVGAGRRVGDGERAGARPLVLPLLLDYVCVVPFHLVSRNEKASRARGRGRMPRPVAAPLPASDKQ